MSVLMLLWTTHKRAISIEIPGPPQVLAQTLTDFLQLRR